MFKSKPPSKELYNGFNLIAPTPTLKMVYMRSRISDFKRKSRKDRGTGYYVSIDDGRFVVPIDTYLTIIRPLAPVLCITP